MKPTLRSAFGYAARVAGRYWRIKWHSWRFTRSRGAVRSRHRATLAAIQQEIEQDGPR